MSLPKCDDVKGRYHLIYKPEADPEMLKRTDQCIRDVLDGITKGNRFAFEKVVKEKAEDYLWRDVL